MTTPTDPPVDHSVGIFRAVPVTPIIPLTSEKIKLLSSGSPPTRSVIVLDMNPTAILAGYQEENNAINMSPHLYLRGTRTLCYMLRDTLAHIHLIIMFLYKY